MFQTITGIIYQYALNLSVKIPESKEYTNFIGMSFVKIEQGDFFMGFDGTPLPDEIVADESHRKDGDFDEHPKHKVKISKPFYMGVYEVTNAQYEQFDSEHKKLRGKRGFSKEDLDKAPEPNKPYFRGPIKYVKIPEDSYGPLFSRHNHDPAIAPCANGDILAIWYTCFREPGRELAIAASRLRYGAEEFDDTSLFWDAPDRNDHAPALWFDGKDTLYHYNGLSAGPGYKKLSLALIMRTSKDNGVTWSKARFVNPERDLPSQPVACEFRTKEGYLVFVSDAPGSSSVLWISRDEGKTWTMSSGKIAGIHAGVVQLNDGRLMALGRGNNIDDRMPKSISDDMGETWNYTASPFPPIGGGQRLVLMRLKEDAIFFASFTGSRKEAEYMPITDISGKERMVTGLFAAVSFDEGETWENIRLISDDGPGKEIETMDGHPVTMGFNSAEPGGYMTACQTDDGIIHIISSQQYYAFNLEWLKTPPPAEPVTS